MNSKIASSAVSFALYALCSLGCSHIPPGGASDVKVSFGVPSVFGVEKTAKGIAVTEKTVKIADSATSIQIFLFRWESMAKDLVLANPQKP